MSADITLKWEWPEHKTISDKFLVKIDGIEPQKSGLFDLKRSPSFADNVPQPNTVTGVIAKPGNTLDGKTVEVLAPQPELEGITADSYAMFGIVEDTICTCIVPVTAQK